MPRRASSASAITSVAPRGPREALLSHRPVGFAVRDATGRGCAFEIDESSGEPLVFGSNAAIRVTAVGVLPVHFVVLARDGLLVAASANARCPALLNGVALPTRWTILAVPSRIRVGAAAIDFFHLRESGTVLIDHDIETTVADPGSRRADTARSVRVQQPRARAGIALVTSLKAHWANATMSTRVLLGVVAILITFLFAR
jgi:hypothetical protein